MKPASLGEHAAAAHGLRTALSASGGRVAEIDEGYRCRRDRLNNKCPSFAMRRRPHVRATIKIGLSAFFAKRMKASRTRHSPGRRLILVIDDSLA